MSPTPQGSPTLKHCTALAAGGPDRWRVISISCGGRHSLALALPDNGPRDGVPRPHSFRQSLTSDGQDADGELEDTEELECYDDGGSPGVMPQGTSCLNLDLYQGICLPLDLKTVLKVLHRLHFLICWTREYACPLIRYRSGGLL